MLPEDDKQTQPYAASGWERCEKGNIREPPWQRFQPEWWNQNRKVWIRNNSWKFNYHFLQEGGRGWLWSQFLRGHGVCSVMQEPPSTCSQRAPHGEAWLNVNRQVKRLRWWKTIDHYQRLNGVVKEINVFEVAPLKHATSKLTFPFRLWYADGFILAGASRAGRANVSAPVLGKYLDTASI